MKMNRSVYTFICTAAFIGFTSTSFARPLSVELPNQGDQREKQVVGWIEPIEIMPEAVKIEAKLAPSFATSSLHAEHVKVFKKRGKQYVRFTIEGRDGVSHTLERAVDEELSEEAIKSKKITLKVAFCIGGERLVVDVLLSDRSGYEQEARIARDAMSGRFLVDPSRTHTIHPDCRNQTK